MQTLILFSFNLYFFCAFDLIGFERAHQSNIYELFHMNVTAIGA